jgi:flagellar motor switch protein FliN/FliY
MNLSQDEINALSEANPQGGNNDTDTSGDIMSPEAIAAMLDESPVSDAPAEPGDADIMSPEAIAAMLDDTAGGINPQDGNGMGDSITDSESSDLDNLFTNLDVDTDDEGLHPLENSKKGMLTLEEVDVLGEVGNISMGAVATTMYSLLDKRVSITTPRVHVYDAKEVLSVYTIPFVVATIEYVEGISGTNLLVLKVEDAALITDLLMGGDGAVEQPIELNEMHLSAMSEIMNQMMGASSTSLSKLLHTPINISPPKSSQVDVGYDVSNLLGDVELVTKISFDMEIEGLLKSELIQLLPYEMSRALAKRFMDIGMGVPSSDAAPHCAPLTPPPAPEAPAAAETADQPASAASAAPVQQSDQAQTVQYTQESYPPTSPYPPPEPNTPYPASPYPQAPYPPYPSAPYPPPYPPSPYPPSPYPQVSSAPGRLVDVHPLQFQSFDTPGPVGEGKGIDLVYNIPLQVTVELGKTRKEISEILDFSMGTIVVLDKIAGDPVEIVVNGKLIARGEVVVIDDSYGVRITDIING